ncbi:MAG TPA: hypothetical protein VE891_00795 [Allosphingosinicella sp.]|nr:hypothetical protein [Allosphingosinicella sp.]
MRRRKREEVTVSFHFLRRDRRDQSGIQHIPFSENEFDDLVSSLQSLPPLDLSNEAVLDRLRYRNAAPIETVERVNDRTAFGLYRASYWGHAYENTEKGKIPAESVSLRPFYFMLYLSEKGRIYLGVQYLGQYGSYIALKNTVHHSLEDRSGVTAHSFRLEASAYSKVEPKEIRVQVSKKPSSIAGDNVFGEGAMIAFKPTERGQAFGAEVKRRLFPVLGTTKGRIQKAVADIVKESQLIDVDDEDITDCTIIGEVNGRRKTIYMLGQSSFASQFSIEVGFNDDGHPLRDHVKEQMTQVLEEQIVSRKE